MRNGKCESLSLCGEKFSGGNDIFHEFLSLFGECAEVAVDLDSVPKVFGLPEEGSEADRHGGCDRTAAEDDFIDGAGWNAYGPRHSVL